MIDVIGYETVITTHSCWLGLTRRRVLNHESDQIPSGYQTSVFTTAECDFSCLTITTKKDMANVNLKAGKRINRTFDIKAAVNVFELMEQQCL